MFMNYQPILFQYRSNLADCRSLPTLETAMNAFGIKSVYGNAFEKLKAFLEDLEGREESDTLSELLQALTQDLKNNMGTSYESSSSIKKQNVPLSEEDLLKKPFYTVETPNVAESTLKNQENFLPSLVESQKENYRELLPHLLLGVKIKEPLELQNLTVSYSLIYLQ